MSQLKAGVGASDTLFQHDRPNKPNRSKFDLSRITNFTCDAGMIVPFDWIFCLPGDDVDIGFEMILDTLPLINPSLTSYKVTTHWYKIDCKDLWEGWQTFITKGRSGTENLTIPQINCGFYKDVPNFNFGKANCNASIFALGNHSLQSFLGNPPSHNGIYNINVLGDAFLYEGFRPFIAQPLPDDARLTNDEKTAINNSMITGFKRLSQINALPFMAYQNIVKYNYVNPNLLQNNHSLFPVEGDHNWFLKYNATVTNFVDYASNSEITGDEVYNYDGVFSSNDTVTRLDQLRYAMFDDDYFTTGLPWLQRGSTTDLGMDVVVPSDFFSVVADELAEEIEVRDYIAGNNEAWFLNLHNNKMVGQNTNDVNSNMYSINQTGMEEGKDAINNLKLLLEKLRVVQNTGKKATAAITANQLREMIAMSVVQERNARVDGSYNAMIYEHWLSNPHAEEHKPTYIGGTCDYVNFATILQSSQTSSDSPLGATAGRGSSGGKGYVGRIHCNDYAYIMGIMIIKPNTTYMQGVEHHLCCENVMEDFPMPEFEGLSPQPILNKELYVSGDSNDNNLLCYQERYVYLKARQNVNRGAFQCKPVHDKLFGSFTQARWFSSRPTFSYQMLCMSPENIRRDWLAYPSQPMFKLQTASKITVVRNLAYASHPNNFGF